MQNLPAVEAGSHGGIVLNSETKWPEGVRCAVALTFDLDAETLWLSRNPQSADCPGVLSQGTYGAKVATPRILAMLNRLDLKATFFVPGWVVEQHTPICRQIVQAGHEIAYHGYLHEPATSAEHEEQLIIKCRKIMQEMLGVTPVGHRSPMFNITPESVEVCLNNGIEYSSNMMDSDHPYWHTSADGRKMAELPTSWLFDDSSHFFFTVQQPQRRPIMAPSTVREIWQAEFDGIYDEQGIMVLVMHPQVIGRVSRLRMLEQLLCYMRSRPGTWIGPGRDIARAVLAD